MLVGFRSSTARVIFVTLYAFAMIAVGFGHRIANSSPASEQVAAAYLLPGGIVPDLCGSDEGSTGHKSADHGCDACRIADAPGLATPDPGLDVLPAGGRSIAAALAESLVVAATLYRPLSRGPPSAIAPT